MVAGIDNVLLLFRSDETVASANLEILLASPHLDKQQADTVLHVAWHLMIEVLQTAFHLHTLVLAEHLALLAANHRIAGIDGVIGQWHGVGILSHEPAQTLLMKRTGLNKNCFFLYIAILNVNTSFSCKSGRFVMFRT